MTAQDEYTDGNGVYLKLEQPELVSLKVALHEALAAHRIKMRHEKIVEQPPRGFHPDSHVAALVKLAQRIDAALHGRKTWNAEWRKLEPYASLGQRR